PARGVVTRRTGGREARGDVRRIVGAVEVGLVTRDSGRALARVDAVAMATGAGRRTVGTREREGAQVVVEPGATPARRGVAGQAIEREVTRRVIGRHGGLIVRHVTATAVGLLPDELQVAGGSGTMAVL